MGNNIRKTVVSALFWGYLVLSLSVFWFAVVIPWLLITPFDPRRRFSHWYAHTWGSHCVRISPLWELQIRGREKFDDSKASVVVSNHQSSADILALFALRKEFRFVSKAVLFFVPFLGWMMAMANYVRIKRGDRKSRESMMNECRRQLAMGNSLAMFPEGTRSENYELGSFKSGAFVLACEAKVPVVPVVLGGMNTMLPKSSLKFEIEKKAYPVLQVLDAVDPAEVDYEPRRLKKLVRDRMVAAQRQIQHEIESRGGLEVPPRVNQSSAEVTTVFETTRDGV